MIRISGIIIGHPCISPDPKFQAFGLRNREKDDPRKGAKDAKYNLNYKFEIRNSKQFQMIKNTKSQTNSFWISIFRFECFGLFEISSFGIRIKATRVKAQRTPSLKKYENIFLCELCVLAFRPVGRAYPLGRSPYGAEGQPGGGETLC